MTKRVRLTDDSLNSHGSRVLTAGVDTTQYERNPVLLYMHERGRVIGYMKDIKVENGEITGEPVFDEATDLSKQCKKQWEVGSLRMVSIGIDIVEMSAEADMVIPGQTSPTITKSRLYEVSVVDIGANNNAIVMRRDNRTITLGRDSENPLPLLSNINNKSKEKEMELKTFALQLGLPETADESSVLAKMTELKNRNETLARENEELRSASISIAVDEAIKEKRLTLAQKDHFIELGKKIGLESLKTTLAAMSPRADIMDHINQSSGGSVTTGEYKKLSDVPELELRKMRANDKGQYRRLFKAEYGYECTSI